MLERVMRALPRPKVLRANVPIYARGIGTVDQHVRTKLAAGKAAQRITVNAAAGVLNGARYQRQQAREITAVERQLGHLLGVDRRADRAGVRVDLHRVRLHIDHLRRALQPSGSGSL